jgi:acetylornithine/N-succinyldiaminopimelate aminotransferase
MSLAQQQELESQYVMPTFGRKPVEFVEGSGMKLVDPEGNEYLDFIAGIGVCSLGHCHPAVSGALAGQAEKLIHVSNYYYIEGRGELSQQLSALLNGGNADDPEPWQTFFANSGAEANECAIKLARLYARRHAQEMALSVGKSEQEAQAAFDGAARTIVVVDRSFHGRTLATLAATAQPAKQEAFQPLPGGFVSTPINDITALEQLFADQGDDICAVMLECVQGESGVHPCTKEFLQAVRRLTSENNALMVCDEVQTGIYRCGTPFAFQHFGVTPDIVSMAKGIASGMPMGACAAPKHIASAFAPGDHGSTFGGSNLAIAAARATLTELEGITDHVNEVGAYMRDKLAQLPKAVEVRGIGLMNAVDLDESVNAPALVTRALGDGLVLNATGAHTLRFLSPLICEKEDVDVMVERLAKLIEQA